MHNHYIQPERPVVQCLPLLQAVSKARQCCHFFFHSPLEITLWANIGTHLTRKCIADSSSNRLGVHCTLVHSLTTLLAALTHDELVDFADLYDILLLTQHIELVGLSWLQNTCIWKCMYYNRTPSNTIVGLILVVYSVLHNHQLVYLVEKRLKEDD